MISSVLGLDLYLKREAIWNNNHTIGSVSIFNIPSHLLLPTISLSETITTSTSTLTSTISSSTDNITLDEELNELVIDNASNTSSTSSGKTCRTCGLTFNTILEQQTHFKSSLHIRNLKRKSIGLDAIMQHNEKDNDVNNNNNDNSKLEEKDDDDDDDNDDDNDDDDDDNNNYDINETVDNELKDINGLYPEGYVTKTYVKGSGSVVTFQRSDDTKWEFSLSSTLCTSFNNNDHIKSNPWRNLAEVLEDIQNISKLWAIFIIRSGRFAGAVYDGNKVILHKVFRRYTVRAKAGGGQSSYDNQGRKAQSAGAQLRRYGEQALKEDVHNLIREWSQQLKCCSKILISVPKTMRSLLFDEDKSKSNLLQRDDPRILSIPFMVGKPTLDEISSIHSKCTKVYFRIRTISNNDDKDITNNKEEVIPYESIETNNNKSKKVAFEKTELPSLPDCQISKDLINACINGDEKLATTIIDKLIEDEEHGVALEFTLNEVLTLPDSIEDLRTPLHIASEMGCSNLVYTLLSAGANPCHTDIRGRKPYYLAKDKAVRDAFRKYRGSSEEAEEQWNWDAAGVPAALTDEKEKEQKEKEKEKKKRTKQRKKEQKEQDEKEAEEARKKLKEQEEELIKQKELSKLNAGVCAFCNKSLFGIKPLDIFDRRCCSSPCVLSLRRKLAADAASKRFS